jgi:hypothetical protein
MTKHVANAANEVTLAGFCLPWQPLRFVNNLSLMAFSGQARWTIDRLSNPSPFHRIFVSI